MHAGLASGLTAVLLLGCASARLERFEFTRPAMGTEFRLCLYADGPARARAAAEAAFACIARLDQALSDYDPASELSRFGAASDGGAPTRWIELSPALFEVLAAAEDVAHASGGAFDVTVGAATRLWRRAQRQAELPSAASLEEARRSVGFLQLELDRNGRRGRLLARGMRLDLGGIAKGYALDQALRVLADAGVPCALLDGGGDLLAGAPPPGEPGWRIAITGYSSRDPARDPAACELWLRNAALATSGDLERGFELEGRRFSHILDARTGTPLGFHALVSVHAPNGVLADAWATALSVLEPRAGLELLARVPGASARIVRANPDGPQVFASDTFPLSYARRAPVPDPPLHP
jgi:thiamine biosynthesis lipoprotein